MPLVDTRKMFKKAYENGYAVGAFNVNNMEQILGIVGAAQETKSPLILQVSAGARKYANPIILKHLIRGAAELAPEIPIAFHLDHGATFEDCKSFIESGGTSVMIDGSHFPLEENIALTKQVVDFARAYGKKHRRYISVEAELGQLAGVEDDVNVEKTSYTNPADVERFVKETGVDSLAIAIGTSHGAFKFKPGTKPQLRFDILEEVEKRLPGFPIVLHGASSIPKEDVAIVNANGGKIADAIGIPEEMLRKAASMAVCKINIDSDSRMAFTAAVRKHFNEHPEHFDPRQYLGPAREAQKSLVAAKMQNVLGCAGKALECMPPSHRGVLSQIV